MRFINRHRWTAAAVTAALPLAVAVASSHREAPFITENPKVDGTDFYMFRSYEPGRDQYVTLIANYLPLQDSYGGPNYFTLDPNAVYDIHVDNDGDAKEDLTFRFRFKSADAGHRAAGRARGQSTPRARAARDDGARRYRPRRARSQRSERPRDVHRRGDSQRPPQRAVVVELDGRHVAHRVHEARRQRRHEVDPRLRGVRGEPRATPWRFRAARTARCSSASARKGSRSTSAKCSTS